MSTPDEQPPPTGAKPVEGVVPVKCGDQSPAPIVPSLKVLKGGVIGQLIPLDGDKFILGRNPDCHVVIPGTAVSRAHAEIVRLQGNYFIEDMKSRAGTYLNDDLVKDRVQLNHNDQIRICEFVCSFHGLPTALLEHERAQMDRKLQDYEDEEMWEMARTGVDPSTRTHEGFILRLHDDPKRAWKDFETRYRPMLVGWLARKGVHQHDSEDLVQEILLTVWRKIPTFEYDPAKGRFRGWLKTILQNELREHRRKRKGSEPLREDLAPSEDIRKARRRSLGDNDDRWERLMAYVKSKSDSRDADIFLRLFEHHKTPAQVAAQLGVTVNAVYVAKLRIMRELRGLRREEADGF